MVLLSDNGRHRLQGVIPAARLTFHLGILMSQPISAEALSYAHTLPVDEHQRAWRSVARIIGVACICYGLYWLAYVAGRALFQWPSFVSIVGTAPGGWMGIYQLVSTWAYTILSVALVAGGIGMMLYQPSLRRLLVWTAAFLIVVAIVGSLVAAYTVFEQWSAGAWNQPGRSSLGRGIFSIGTQILFSLIHPLIVCGLTIALLTRRPLVEALEAAQPRILSAGLQILLALALVVGMTGLIARPLTVFMDIAAPLLQDKGMAYGVGFYEWAEPSLASAWYVSTRAVLWICGGLMVIGALVALGLRRWGLQLLITQARVAIVIMAPRNRSTTLMTIATRA